MSIQNGIVFIGVATVLLGIGIARLPVARADCPSIFGDEVVYGAGHPVSVAIGDLDGDGDLDLAAPNYWGNDVSVLLNNGDGTFAASLLYDVGVEPQGVSIGDLDGAGYADLAVGNVKVSTISVLLNQCGAICEGDANGDGLVDPLDAGFALARFGCPVGTGDPDCDIADMNGDGLVDPLDSGFVLARFGPCE